LKKFKLLWRGTRDGFAASTFHKNCDGKPNTLTIIRDTEGFIFGGYASEPWSSNDLTKSDSTAFLFTLKNPINTPRKLNKKNAVYYVYHDINYGPFFGIDSDLVVSDQSDLNRKSFVSFYGNYNFRTHEIEVFQVI